MRENKKRLRVERITYYGPFFPTEKDGTEGWATVNVDDPNDWIFYGPDALDVALFQAKLTNGYHGHGETAEIVDVEASRRARYKPYQWM